VVLGVSDWVLLEDLPETLLEGSPRDPGTKYHHSSGKPNAKPFSRLMCRQTATIKQPPNYLVCTLTICYVWCVISGLRDEINRSLAVAAGR